MGQYFSLSGETSVGIVLAEVLDEKPDTERYAFLAALPDALKEVEAYAATSEAHQAAMRASMAAPNDAAALHAALESLAPGVRAVVRWCDLAEAVGAALPGLLADFGAEVKVLAPKKEFLGGDTSAGASLCALLRFLLAFDAAKLATPCVQNEFAFIKRAGSKSAAATAAILDANKAPAVTMFIAEAAPLLARCARGLDADSARALASVATGVAGLLASKKALEPEAKAAAGLKTMVAALVLVDRANKTAGGAFCRASGVDAAKCVAAINKRARSPEEARALLSVVQYTTINYAAHASSAVRSGVEG